MSEQRGTSRERSGSPWAWLLLLCVGSTPAVTAQAPVAAPWAGPPGQRARIPSQKGKLRTDHRSQVGLGRLVCHRKSAFLHFFWNRTCRDVFGSRKSEKMH